jgi:DNA invertase Pin-like site-specific DNA recombinase
MPKVQISKSAAAVYVRKSTAEHQRFSIENQLVAIGAYASARGLEIVRTYSDSGKSGLKVANRHALKQLLLDVQSGEAQYRSILVYDVSRWGRFQDADESAYYEYACKRAGIAVHYCAEQFTNDGTPLSTIVKGIKRAMAAEYSRELGVKVFAGQRNIVQRGFRLGSRPGYGMRRVLVDATGKPKQFLKFRERKSISSDRIVLAPGPKNEVDVVRWIFLTYARGERPETAIANSLNRRHIPNGLGTPWNIHMVRRILRNPKYIGENVWNRSTQRLGIAPRPNPPAEWIRSPINFKPIVAKRTYEKVQALIAARLERVPDSVILENLRKLHKKKGRLTTRMIDAERSLPSSSCIYWRFGGISKAYRKIGVEPRWSIAWVDVNQRLREMRRRIAETIRHMFESRGDSAVVSTFGRNLALRLNGKTSIYIILTRCVRGRWGGDRWRIRLEKTAGMGAAVVMRTDRENVAIAAYYFFPDARALREQREMKSHDLSAIDPYRIGGPAALLTLV